MDLDWIPDQKELYRYKGHFLNYWKNMTMKDILEFVLNIKCLEYNNVSVVM